MRIGPKLLDLDGENTKADDNELVLYPKQLLCRESGTSAPLRQETIKTIRRAPCPEGQGIVIERISRKHRYDVKWQHGTNRSADRLDGHLMIDRSIPPPSTSLVCSVAVITSSVRRVSSHPVDGLSRHGSM